MNKLSLDAADIRILCAIQKYGPLSKSKLAEIVNLSSTPCWARLSKLKNAGLIQNYSAKIALNKIVDFTKVIVTLSLNKHRKSDFDKFERFVNHTHEIIECVATGGGTDYVMTLISPNLAAFQDLMSDMLEAELGVDRYVTYFVTREVKSSPPDISSLVANTGK